VRAWKSLRGRIDDQRYREVLAQLEYQAGQAQVWRDAVTNWFLRESGIPDAKGRVGNYPGRFEAESMMLQGYEVKDVKPWEAASGGKAIECSAGRCTATLRYPGAGGKYTIHVQYFDLNAGKDHFSLSVENRVVDNWDAVGHLRAPKVDGSTSTRRTLSGVALRTGAEIRIEGGPIDYIELLPEE
jgi:alpha-glucuronidase